MVKKQEHKPHKKEAPLDGKTQMDRLLKSLEENEMIDDHGPVIIGRRDQKPRHPEPEEE